ncbi:hypothetical protein IF1G_03945 [Cordyceps javanica]|uniref:Uncharacterized protein n=1 Tax=Cordyceps javanica TaxID=43265 RepID=A0A545V906_9HYPO|nr:hypothetical protein IF1G_03945 [Cordyceps javanica]
MWIAWIQRVCEDYCYPGNEPVVQRQKCEILHYVYFVVEGRGVSLLALNKSQPRTAALNKGASEASTQTKNQRMGACSATLSNMEMDNGNSCWWIDPSIRLSSILTFIAAKLVAAVTGGPI